MNIGVRVSFLISTFVFSKCGPESGIGSSIFSFLRDLHFVFHSGCIDLHSHQHVQGFSPSYLSTFWWWSFWHMWYLIVILICIFLIAMLNIFSCACELYVFFGEMSPQVFWTFFDWIVILILSCLSCCIFWILTPCWSHHLQIFSHSIDCNFVLWFLFLCKIFRSQLLIFAFLPPFCLRRSKTILLWFMSKDVLPTFTSRSLMVSNLSFRSLRHFESIFIYGVKECFNLIVHI